MRRQAHILALSIALIALSLGACGPKEPHFLKGDPNIGEQEQSFVVPVFLFRAGGWVLNKALTVAGIAMTWDWAKDEFMGGKQQKQQASYDAVLAELVAGQGKVFAGIE